MMVLYVYVKSANNRSRTRLPLSSQKPTCTPSRIKSYFSRLAATRFCEATVAVICRTASSWQHRVSRGSTRPVSHAVCASELPHGRRCSPVGCPARNPLCYGRKLIPSRVAAPDTWLRFAGRGCFRCKERATFRVSVGASVSCRFRTPTAENPYHSSAHVRSTDRSIQPEGAGLTESVAD